MVVEEVLFSKDHWEEVQRNIIIFFKTYVVKVLLGIRPLEFCPCCDKPCLEPDEIMENDDRVNSISCDSCSMWYHWSCVSITSSQDTEKQMWICKFCENLASQI
jgi:hypothetical protein